MTILFMLSLLAVIMFLLFTGLLSVWVIWRGDKTSDELTAWYNKLADSKMGLWIEKAFMKLLDWIGTGFFE